MTWTIDEDEGTITFNVTITGMGAGYFGVGIGDKMIGSDIFAFVSFEVTFFYCYCELLQLIFLLRYSQKLLKQNFYWQKVIDKAKFHWSKTKQLQFTDMN